ncbi:HAD-IA family hydrolase [Paracoccus laeviglucosivorans]|uniref:Phosphoglycolate phosphatase n=1 Tax=Paracoccus laeviglucosivorans TaxID=1197861 RepID=A0A521D8W7_9RHOB|nr:HAD-IA family hydrolase [Paracoccus laeviglucosivorans]SMO68156.1 phosphoglycolate phosphatase [Paracoccus laeviglucosivorans]
MKLVLFDVDGTLVNSQHEITQSMNLGMKSAGLPEMDPALILSIVGLSLPIAVARLLPEATPDQHDRVVLGYREAFFASRTAGALPPLYDGALDCLDALAAQDEVLLGIATGKAMRGLVSLLDGHGLGTRFITKQTADGHPSKPHPAMLHSALSETGVAAGRAVMIGDTSFDMEMARSAGILGFGVSWGYHPSQELHAAGAALVAPDYAALTQALLDWTTKETA